MSTSISEMQTVGKSALLEMLLEQDTFKKLVADVKSLPFNMCFPL